MIKITSNNSEDFTLIKSALTTLESSTSTFLDYFAVAEQVDSVNENLTVILRNNRPFKLDLNRQKYLVAIPSAFIIDSFEFVKTLDRRAMKVGAKKYFTNVLVKCHMEGHAINFLLVLSGFTSDAIRIIKDDSVTATLAESISNAVNPNELEDSNVDNSVADMVNS